jgi:hypothetical protein
MNDGLKHDRLLSATPTKAVEDYRSPRRYRDHLPFSPQHGLISRNFRKKRG